MRLDYLKVGDNFTNDEYNAVVSMFLLSDTSMGETIRLSPHGFKGDYATYYFEFSEEDIAYRESDIQIIKNTGVCKVRCVSDLKAVFTIDFEGNTYVCNDEQVIVIDLSDYTVPTEHIFNSFQISIEYYTPFIADKPQQTEIHTTKDLKEVINTLEAGEEITIHNDLTHNLRKHILIDKDVTINFNGHTVSSSRKTDSLFLIDNDYKLTVTNGVFTNFKADDGAIFYNKGILISKNCTFKECTAIYDGAVCYNDYGEAYFDDCDFINCEADNGAVFNKGDIV